MFCSTIIPTIGRSTLSRAVRSVLDQAFTADDFEVIVVNDSGCSLPADDWQKNDKVRIIHTNRRERCVARNAGAAIAKGRYLHFLDDDDWLLPGAFENFWELAQRANDAVWLYGSSQLVDRHGKPLIQLHHNMNGNCFVQVVAGEWIPLQASLIDAKVFFAVGGFNPLIPGIEDIDLGRWIALYGQLRGMTELVACIGMGEDNSTTNQIQAQQYGRWAREKIFNEPGVFSRMRTSATSSSYWHGRIVRVYFTSMIWNLQRKNTFIALSRAVFGTMGFMLAGWHIFSKSFWRAITTRHISQTFLNGFKEAGLSPS